MYNSHRNKHQGFTLIEMLVALAIMAMLSIAAYQVLYQVQLSNAVSKDRTKRFNEVQKAMVVMSSDFRQIAARSFRSNDKEPFDQLVVWKKGVLGGDDYGLLFTRFGWSNPQQQFPRGDVAKVGYHLNNNTLERVWWNYPDTTKGDNGTVMPLLTHVEKFSVRFYGKKKWNDEWDDDDTLPQAIAIELTLSDYGKIERIFLVPGDENGSSTTTSD